MQHALLQTARHWERISTSPEAYARRVMYHQNISWWRKRRFTETTLGSYDVSHPAAGQRPAPLARRGARAADAEAAHDPGAALLRGPHRGADRGGHRRLRQHREVHGPPRPGPPAHPRARPRGGRLMNCTTSSACWPTPLPVPPSTTRSGTRVVRFVAATGWYLAAVVLALVVILGGLAALVLGPPRTVDPADDHRARRRDPEPDRGPATWHRRSRRTSRSGGRRSPSCRQESDTRRRSVRPTGATTCSTCPDSIAAPTRRRPSVPTARGWPGRTPDPAASAWPTSRPGRASVSSTISRGRRSSSFRWSPARRDPAPCLGMGTEAGRVRGGRVDLRTGRWPRRSSPATSSATRGGLHLPRRDALAIPAAARSRSTQFVSPRTDPARGRREQFSACRPTSTRTALPPCARWAGRPTTLVLATASTSTGDEAGRPAPRPLHLTGPPRVGVDVPHRDPSDLPGTPVSVAVDLIPDLDGTTNQQLTHDFGEPVG